MHIGIQTSVDEKAQSGFRTLHVLELKISCCL